MKLQTLLLGALIGLLLIGNVIKTHNLLTAPYPGHNDFLTPWEASRSYWVDGLPVYSEQSNVNIQTRIYGRAIEAGEFPNYFAYPFYTVFVMWPLVLLPYSWASAVWMVVLETLLIASLLLLLNLYRWRPRPLMLAFVIVWMLLFYPSTRGLILGQVSHLVFFLEVLAIWALARERQSLAGVALALSAIKPQMGYLIIPFLLLWGLRERHWRFVGTFVAGFGLLLVGSFVLQPSWVGDWLAEIGRYQSYTAVGSPVWVIAQYYLGSGAVGEANGQST
jgi:hypothetical protein